VLGWAAGLFLTGLSYGSLGDEVGDLMGDSQMTRDLFAQGGGALVDAFYATAILMLAMMACGYAVSSAIRPRHDEDEGRVEVLLATGLSRQRWLLAQVLLTVAGSALVLAAAGLGLGIGYALTSGDSGAIGRYLVATVPLLAPVLVLSGLARLLFGVVPRWTSLAWTGLLLAVVILLFGPLFKMPEWLQDLSPFHHLALVPAEEFRWAPFLVLAAIAAALSAAGQAAFRRRDVEVR
jgi:ABC-2 type transport system permease protein